MFIISTSPKYGITNMNSIANIYIDGTRITALTDVHSQFTIYEDDDCNRREYVYDRLCDYIISDKSIHISNILEEYEKRMSFNKGEM
jgi:hypothetical protein